MIILHIANLTESKSKGPNTNVPKNVIYGNKYANVGLYNLNTQDPPIAIPKGKYFSYRDFKSINSLPEPFNKPDIVVFQGVFFIKYCMIAKQLLKKGIPYIIVPRCSLTSAGIKSHYLKKKLASLIFFNSFISKAKSIHFLTKNEFEESKNNFKFQNYFILGNGFEIPLKKHKPLDRNDFVILFIARYNVYHKGLDILLDSVRENKLWFVNNNVTIHLYGSDSDNGESFLRKYISENDLSRIVKLNGPVFDKQKELVLLDADIFIHTSRLEGQPTSIIEAISYGIPVIVTPGTNMLEEVEKYKLGYTTKLNSKEIFECIRKAFEDKKNHTKISKNEIEYAKSSFDWDKIIKESIKNYK